MFESFDKIISITTAFFSIFVCTLSYFFMQNAKKRNQNYKQLDEYLQLKYNSDISNNIYKNISKNIISTRNSEFKNLLNELIELKKDESKMTEKLITSYHEQALSQAKIQFNVSLIASIVGFGLICLSLIINYSNPLNSAIGSIPGIIIDAIAALFFKQASDTRKRATELYDRLRQDQTKAFALEIAESIENKELKDKLKVHLSLHIAGVEKSILEKINS